VSRATVLKAFKEELHISNSQIGSYQACSLKYYFHYVEKRPEKMSNIAFSFGSAIHAALELYYNGIKNSTTEPLDAVTDCFRTTLALDLNNKDVPVSYPKTMPDKESAIAMGVLMLEVFYEKVDVSDFEIVGVELPLSAPLYTENGDPTDFILVGIIDLLLKNQNGDFLIVDNKTAARSMTQATANEDTQMTAYSYLLAANGYIFPRASVECRFDVLVKTKTPQFQQVYTFRTRDERKRLVKVANMVLAGIDARIFYPQTSWMCNGCGYSEACAEW